ncbi:MAG: ABC transporter permease [Bryobacteraceae bacterium]
MTLGIGVGANTAIFSGVYAYLGTPLPYPQPEKLVWLEETRGPKTAQLATVSWLDAQDWKSVTALKSIALFRLGRMRYGPSGAQYVTCINATADLFPALGTAPQLGRVPATGDNGYSRSAVITGGLWRGNFGATPNVIGQSVELNGQHFTVTAVLPSDFNFLYLDTGVFLPLEPPSQASDRRDNRVFSAIGRIRSDANLAQLQGVIASISARLERESPQTNFGWAAHVTTLEDFLIPRNSRVGAVTALAAVSLVLAIACANVASLLLSRGVTRRKEMAIRVALGASAKDLRSLLLSESMLLAIGGGILGIVIAYAGIPILKSVTPAGTPRMEAMQLNLSALLYTALVSVAAGILSGIAPVWSLSGESTIEVLRRGGPGNTGSDQRALKTLVVLQIAIVIVLMTATGLLIRSLQHQLAASPGFNKNNLLIAQVALPERKYRSSALTANYYRELLNSLSRQPHIQSAAATDALPIGACGPFVLVAIEGQPSAGPRDQSTACRFRITPGFFRTLEIPMLKGRENQ